MNFPQIRGHASHLPAFSKVCRFHAGVLISLLLSCSVASGAVIRPTPDETLMVASYWGHVQNQAGSHKQIALQSPASVHLSLEGDYDKHRYNGQLNITPAPPGTTRVLMNASGTAEIIETISYGVLQDAVAATGFAIFQFRFSPKSTWYGAPITSIPGSVNIPHSLYVESYSSIAYGNAAFQFVLRRLSTTIPVTRTVLLDARLELKGEAAEPTPDIDGVLARDPAFLNAFLAADCQAFPIVFTPGTTYEVWMKINGGASVVSDPKEIAPAFFTVSADPVIELADDGTPYPDAFDLMVSPELVGPPMLKISGHSEGLELSWEAPESQFRLEASEGLSGGDWQSLAGEVVHSDNANAILLVHPDQTTFYRLVEQP